MTSQGTEQINGQDSQINIKEIYTMASATIRCVTEGMEETFDRYDGILKEDPMVQSVNMRVRDIIESIRKVLIRGNAPAEALSLLDELDDEYVNLDTEKLKTLARTGWKDVQLAYELGRKYCELEKRRERLRHSEPDEKGCE